MKSSHVLLLCLVSAIAWKNLPAQSASQTQALTPITSLDSIDDFYAKRTAALTGQVYAYAHIISQKSGISEDSLKNKIIFIHTWFASCAPCVAEFEELNHIYQQWKDNKDFVFLSFTFEDQQTIAEIKKKYHLPYKVTSIDAMLCRTINLSGGFPGNILLQKNFIINHPYFVMGSVNEIPGYIRKQVSADIHAALYPRE